GDAEREWDREREELVDQETEDRIERVGLLQRRDERVRLPISDVGHQGKDNTEDDPVRLLALCNIRPSPEPINLTANDAGVEDKVRQAGQPIGERYRGQHKHM